MRLAIVLIALPIILLNCVSQVYADRGTLPIMNVDVYGPGQKAIIAWNGEVERLILSTDLYASLETKVLELMPLPSEPILEMADFKSFQALQSLIMRKMPRTISPGYRGGLEIIFHEKIGAHDITVLKANSTEELSRFITDYTAKMGISNIPPVSEGAYAIFEDYLMRGFNYWVLDLVDIPSTTRSIEPIAYEFKSQTIYYPMKISATTKGPTRINLYLITPEPLNENNIPVKMQIAKYLPSNQNLQFKVSKEDLASIDLKIQRLFDGEAWFTALKYEGDTGNIDFDVEIPKSPAKCRSLSVNTDKNQYMSGEAVKITVNFTHLFPGCFEVAVVHFHQIRLEIVDSNGGTVQSWRWNTTTDMYRRVVWTAGRADNYTVRAGSYWSGERLEVKSQSFIKVIGSNPYGVYGLQYLILGVVIVVLCIIVRDILSHVPIKSWKAKIVSPSIPAYAQETPTHNRPYSPL
ncbi:DUF2330 domain-containing protein [Candidatus Bathyarchaeota archaeon]|nr:DUF2330 domain-containing protein [Candidatus Bathyarchaeota archaeon]